MEFIALQTTLCFRDVWEFFPGLALMRGEGKNTLNFYYTQPDSDGLFAHDDPYDIIVVQLFGKKEWTVGTQPPFVLSSGDVFYLPRSRKHHCRTFDSHSGHLALGLDRTYDPTRLRLRFSHPRAESTVTDGGSHGAGPEVKG